MNNSMKKILSLVLSFAIVFSVIPNTGSVVFADSPVTASITKIMKDTESVEQIGDKVGDIKEHKIEVTLKDGKFKDDPSVDYPNNAETSWVKNAPNKDGDKLKETVTRDSDTKVTITLSGKLGKNAYEEIKITIPKNFVSKSGGADATEDIKVDNSKYYWAVGKRIAITKAAPIVGETGKDLPENSTVEITLVNLKFNALADKKDVKSWIKENASLPTDVKVTLSSEVKQDSKVATLKFSGKPNAKFDEKALTIEIPKSQLKDANENATLLSDITDQRSKFKFKVDMSKQLAPPLQNVIANDDPASDDKTKITLPAAASGNSFVYKISDDEKEVSIPELGEDLSTWKPMPIDGTIATTNDKNIGIAEVDNQKKAVKFTNVKAVVVPTTANLKESKVINGIVGLALDANQSFVIEVKGNNFNKEGEYTNIESNRWFGTNLQDGIVAIGNVPSDKKSIKMTIKGTPTQAQELDLSLQIPSNILEYSYYSHIPVTGGKVTIKIEELTATVAGEIKGKEGSELTAKELTVTLNGAEFKDSLTNNSSWKIAPDLSDLGLSIKSIKRDDLKKNQAKIELSGTPNKENRKEISITIPKDAIKDYTGGEVKATGDAKFNIEDKTVPPTTAEPKVIDAEVGPNGDEITVTFDKEMQSPVGHHDLFKFTIGVNTVPRTFKEAKLSADKKKISLIINGSAIEHGDKIELIYKGEKIKSEDGQMLKDFTKEVKNNAVQKIEELTGVVFEDDPTSNDKTIIKLPSLTSGKSFVYQISGDNNPVKAPKKGDDLSSWTKVKNEDKITAADGKNIGVAEVDGTNKALRFVNAKAVTKPSSSVPSPAAPKITKAVTSTKGDKIILTFDKEMADPNDKHDLFKFTVNGAAGERKFTKAELLSSKKEISLTIEGAPLKKTDNDIKLSYTGTSAKEIKSEDNKVLANVTDKVVTNEVKDTPAPSPSPRYDDDDDDDSSSNDSSSSGTPGSVNRITNTEKKPEIVKPNTNVSGDTAKAKVNLKAVEDSIKKDKQIANNGLDIKVESKEKVKDVELSLSQVALNAIVNAKAKEVRIATPVGDVKFDLAAIKQIQSQAKNDIELSIKKKEDIKLTDEVRAVVGNRPIYDLSIMAGKNKNISSFGTGQAEVRIPYVLASGERAERLTVYHLPENKIPTEVPGARYDARSKAMVFTTGHFSLYAVGEKPDSQSDMTFRDINGHWAKANIDYVVSKGLMNGVSKDMFAPSTSMTRGMFVTVIGRMAKIDTKAYTGNKFADVNSSMYYAPYIEWAVQKGIVKGMSETSFMPDSPVTREQMAVIIQGYAKAANIKLSEKQAGKAFADQAMISTWASDAVKTMHGAGILSGKGGNIFDPKGTATRAEVAKVIHTLLESK